MDGRKVTALIAGCAVLCLFMALWTAGAFAQENCGPRKDIVKMIYGKYHEAIRGAGTINDKAVAEFFISEAGTWTLLVTVPDGTTCIVAAGDGWDELPPPPKGNPS